VVKGATMFFRWKSFEPDAGVYDWSKIDAAIAHWHAAGKEVNLVLETSGYGDAGTLAPDWYTGPTFTCNGSVFPVWWGSTFISQWQSVITEARRFDGDAGYLRFGLGCGGENSPFFGGVNGCEAALVDAGFTTVAAGSWPSPASAQWHSQISPVWLSFQKTMVDGLKAQQFVSPISFSLSPIVYQPPPIDFSTPDDTAQLAADAGFIVGNQGWRESDQTTASSGHCAGDWCAIFPSLKGVVPLELQQTLVSDPVPRDGGTTGSFNGMFPYAMSQGVQIFEVYADDLLCTFDPTYNGAGGGFPHAACVDAGYPALFTNVAQQVN
jgi:hypothetical protein